MIKRILALVVLICFVASSASAAQKICLRVDKKFKTTRRVVAPTARCPKGFTELINTETILSGVSAQVGAQGIQGPKGETGPAGAQGPKGDQGVQGLPGTGTIGSIFGDGSSGDIVFPVGISEFDQFKLYANVTVPAGAIVRVPHGSTLRALGTLTVDGILEVQDGGQGGVVLPRDGVDGSSIGAAVTPPATSANFRPAGAGNTAAACLTGCVGSGGVASPAEPYSLQSLRNIIRVSVNLFGGGGGGSLGGRGGNGGGSAAFYAAQGIIINGGGSVVANGLSGLNGGGGGAGGLLIFASNGSFQSLGNISVSGGNGSPHTIDSAPGGAGGGGVVNILAPSISISSVNVSGGSVSPAAQQNAISAPWRSSGGGAGGSFGGSGGDGATLLTNTKSSTNPIAGGAGIVNQILISDVGRFFQ